MAIYENKFEIGDVVVVTNKMQCLDLWVDMASVMNVKDFSNDWPNEREVYKVISYTLQPKTNKFIYHVRNCITEKGYLMMEEGLEIYNGQDKPKVEQSPKQPYKPRAKWVKNIGEKPDLPDGTMVKVKLQEGRKDNGVVESWYWGLDTLDPDCEITKWKLADDWNDVVDGQAPDIDGETLIDVKWKDGDVFEDYQMKDIYGWSCVKKWRYAKEKKAK